MKLARVILTALLAGILLSGCGPGSNSDTRSAPPAAPADQRSQDFGSHVLHFNALSTDQLQPAVAQQYGIVRSKNRALLNISMVKKIEGTSGQPVSGTVNATASNLTGQLKTISLREIKDGGAVYYIADLPVANGETLKFDISATPLDSEVEAFRVSFNQKFYAD